METWRKSAAIVCFGAAIISTCLAIAVAAFSNTSVNRGERIGFILWMIGFTVAFGILAGVFYRLELAARRRREQKSLDTQ
jgi:hypothetical protein